MKDYMYQKDLHWLIKEKPESMTNADWLVKWIPKGMDEEDWELLDQKALGEIRLNLTK